MDDFIFRDGSLRDESLSAIKMNFMAWWKFFEADVLHLRSIAAIFLSLSTSLCQAEKSFSMQQSIHTLESNRLIHSSIRKLLYCNFNMHIVQELSTKVREAAINTEMES